MVPMTMHARHLPNVLAHSYRLDSGTVVTLFKATPGDTAPRMQMQVAGCEPVDCGPVENPDRFGAHSTPADFQNWATRFAETA